MGQLLIETSGLNGPCSSVEYGFEHQIWVKVKIKHRWFLKPKVKVARLQVYGIETIQRGDL